MRMTVRQWVVLVLSAIVSLSLSACSLPQVKAEDRLFQDISLEFLGETIVPKTLEVDNTLVGGLSGIIYSPKDDVFYTVSDDRSTKAPARFYQFKLDLDAATGKPIATKFTSVTTLKNAAGDVYEKGTIDPEGIAITPQGTVWISSEGVAIDGIPPFIQEHDIETGKLLRSLRIPDQYIPQTDDKGNRQGVQNNMAFESLTLNANAARMGATEPYRVFTAAENALEQDKNPDSESMEGDRVRFMHYSVQDRRIDLIAEYLYALEDKPIGSEKSGLTEMLSLDGSGRFLSLERNFGLEGFKIELFQTVFAGSKDTSMLPSIQGLDTVVKPAQKELVADLSMLDITLDNLEGMTIATPDSADLAGLLNGYPRFFEVNWVVLDRQDSPIGPKSRILLR
jgi:hypothetical protein